jgi:hypothetical protein
MAAVMTVTADGQACVGPVCADAAHQAAQMAADFLSGRRLARPQQHRHRARGRGVVDVDGQEAALVIVRVEQGKLLVAVHDIAGVVDVERDGGRRTGVAGAVEVDHGVAHAHHFAQGRRVLPARHGRLRAQIIATVRQPPTGQLKPRVSAQMVEIVGVLVATGDSKDPGAQNVIDAVRHQQRVARVRDQPPQRFRYPQLPLHNAEQHDTTVGRDPSAVESRNDLLAFNGWKIKRQKAIVGHGGCGSVRSRGQDGFGIQSLSKISTLRDTRQRIPAMP